jgi:hypothetical protein
LLREQAKMGRANIGAMFPTGTWPAEMRAPTAAAFFDFVDTAQLFAAVRRGEVPRPTATRGARREPLWARAACEQWVADRHQLADNATAPSNDIAALLAP